MASPTLPKLPTLPWPALVSASLLLHAGVLSVGLPKMLRVSQPDSTSVNIPVTLIDEDAQPAATPANPSSSTSPTSPSPPAEAPAPQSVLPSALQSAPQSAPQPVSPAPAGGQNPAVAPGARADTQPPATPPQRETGQADTSAPQPPVRENVGEDHRATTPENEPLQDRQTEGTQTAAETEDSPQAPPPELGTSPTEVRIIGDEYLPKESGGDQIDTYPTPSFQMPLTLSIPRSHGCQGTLPTDTTVGVAVDADGFVSSLRLYQPDIYEQTPDAKLADCLLSAALQNAPSAVRFTPATRLTNIGEAEPVATDRVQLRLGFR